MSPFSFFIINLFIKTFFFETNLIFSQTYSQRHYFLYEQFYTITQRIFAQNLRTNKSVKLKKN